MDPYYSNVLSSALNAVKRTPGNIVGGPVDLANLAGGLLAGRGMAGLHPTPVGGSAWINDKFGLQPTRGLGGELAESLLGMLDPSAQLKATLLAGMGVAGLMAGAKAGVATNTGKAGKQRGIIVPVGAAPKYLQATGAIHSQPITGGRVITIPDVERRIDVDAMVASKLKSKEGKSLVEILPGMSAYDVLNKVGDYPQDLQKYLQSIEVVPGKGQVGGGSYSPRADKITLNPSTSPKELASTLLHEIQHSAQYLYDMPQGGSPTEFYRDFGKFDTAKTLLHDRIKAMNLGTVADIPPQSVLSPELAPSRAAFLSSPESVMYAAKQLRGAQLDAYNAYRSLAGETEARVVQYQFENPYFFGGVPDMMSAMGQPASSVISRDAIKSFPKVDDTPAIQDLLNLILGVPPSSLSGAKP